MPVVLPRVFSVLTRLGHFLMHFGSYAFMYGMPGGHVTFETAAGATGLRIAVVDDGIGIPTERQDRLFEPFQRAGQETGPIEGTGIGLALSKRLATMMN